MVFRWFEVDYADILDYKDRLMEGEVTRCRRERLSIDINDPVQGRVLRMKGGRATASL